VNWGETLTPVVAAAMPEVYAIAAEIIGRFTCQADSAMTKGSLY
jgi:hypothetical protein